MNTTNLISTPNITGNIGSCEVKQVETPMSIGGLTKVYQVILTNSCTGEIVSKYEYKDYSGAWLFGFIVFILLVCLVGYIATALTDEKTYY